MLLVCCYNQLLIIEIISTFRDLIISSNSFVNILLLAMGIEQYKVRETWVEAENVIFPFISHLESRRVISLPREFNTESPNTPENNCTTMKDKISILRTLLFAKIKCSGLWFLVWVHVCLEAPSLEICQPAHRPELSWSRCQLWSCECYHVSSGKSNGLEGDL